MVTRQAGLLCTAAWRVVNLCHLGTIGCIYCSLFMCLWHLEHTVSHTVSMNESQMSVSSFTVVRCLYPGTSFLRRETFTSVIPHPHSSFTLYTCLPACLSLSCSDYLKNIAYSRVPRRGRQRAGMPAGSPCPPQRVADVTALLPGDHVRHINAFTHWCDFSPQTSN